LTHGFTTCVEFTEISTYAAILRMSFAIYSPAD
jgi:hypothetical protein